MDNFLGNYKLLNLTEEVVEKPNRLIILDKAEKFVKKALNVDSFKGMFFSNF